MAAYTLGTASQATGCAKSTILRAIKAGRISAVRDDLGQWQIEPAQLFHVFPTLASPDATPQMGPMKRDATTDTLCGRSVTTGGPLMSASRPRTPPRNACCYPDPQRLRNGTHRRRARAHRLPKRR
jgi:hypothetical protein